MFNTSDSDMTLEVAGFGDITLDFLFIASNLANYNKPTFIKEFKYSGEGSVATALVACQRLGGNSALIGSIGNDWIGKEIFIELQKEKINCSGIQINKNISSAFSFIQVNEKSGKRAIAYNSSSRKFLKFDLKAKKIIKKVKILLIDGYTPKQDIEAVEFAKSCGIKIMFDTNVLLDGTDKLLKNTNYLITSESFLYDYL